MVLDLWNTGDTITAINANKRGVRRGSTSDISGIAGGTLFVGDHLFNTNYLSGQLCQATSPQVFSNYGIHMITADSTQVSNVGTTPTQVKDVDFIIDPQTIGGTLLVILVRIWCSANQTNCRIRLNGGGSDSLVLTSTATSAGTAVVKGTISITALAAGRNTLQIFLDNTTGGQTAFLDSTEIWGL